MYVHGARVVLVNAEAGFVLINSQGKAMPEAGVALKCMRDGVETGIIAVGKERQGTNVVADVVTGKVDVRESASRLPEVSARESADDMADEADEIELADEEEAA